MYFNPIILRTLAVCSFLATFLQIPWLTVIGQSPQDIILKEASHCSTAFGKEEPEIAVDHCRRAAALARSGGVVDLELSSLASLGVSLVRMGRYSDAAEPLKRAIILADRLGSQGMAILMRHQAGFVCYWRNDYGCALDYYREGLKIEEKYPNPSLRRTLLAGLGDAYSYLGQLDEAEDAWLENLSLAKQLNEQQAETLANMALGSIAYQRGDYPRSERYARAALDQSRKYGQRNLEATALSALGRYALDRRQADQARAYLETALSIYRSIGNRYNEAVILRSLGELALQQQKPDQAVRSYQHSLSLARGDQESYGIAESLAGLGLAQYRQGRLVEAELSLKESIRVLEDIRELLGPRDALKISLFETQSSPYDILQVVLVKRGRPLDALLIAERGRARAYADMLMASGARHPTSALADPIPHLSVLRGVARQQQAFLLSYSVLPGQLLIWVIPPEGEIVFHSSVLESSGPDSLEALVARARKELADPTHPSLRDLHRVLLDPVAASLPANPNVPVVVIPHKSLFLVPFAALQAADGTRMIDHHTLLFSPSVRVLDLLMSRPRTPSQGGRPLVVGNPEMPSPFGLGRGSALKLPPLKASGEEAQSVAALLGVSPLLGTAATETEVVRRLPQAPLIHLASHGSLDQISAGSMPGAIALAPSRQDDGILTSAEIIALKLKAELVVLSACDTGRGLLTGDGVVGLSRAWLGAGARQVMVSLWSVPDLPTSELMQTFHKQRLQGQTPAAALRLAMLEASRRNPLPMAWAGFILMGPAR
ncbi:MAG: CHAT domain-containing protein [Cyanobium sp.]